MGTFLRSERSQEAEAPYAWEAEGCLTEAEGALEKQNVPEQRLPEKNPPAKKSPEKRSPEKEVSCNEAYGGREARRVRVREGIRSEAVS